MNFRSVINIICGILGLGIIVFGILVRAGLLAHVDPARGMVPIFLGAIIALWSLYSLRRHR